ncbi:MAG: L,D-transpeptidase, partial [Verrucomicrobiales bacterium]|nr:L,D-transpeptidase [Verrucomicrobiales bacterium]
GYEAETTTTPFTPLDFYISTLSDSEIGFEISDRGVAPNRTIPGGEVFQQFDVGLDEVTDDPALQPGDQAVEIDFNHLFDSHARFDDLSDAAEPRDYVRRFLESMGQALDSADDSKFEGRHVPLIRWQPRDGDSAGAQVQLLGILRATDKQFEAFCNSDSEDFDVFLEEAEVEAHGVREMAVALAIVGISLGSATDAQAGPFKKLLKKRAEARAERQEARQVVRSTKAPVQQHSSGWVDAHRDARFNYDLLNATHGVEAERKVVVDVSQQRAYLLIDGQIAIDTAVSTARAGKITPRGEFKITERIRTGKRSTLYGCEMPFWMRLDTSEYGMHIGDLPGHAASAGCVRLPHSVAPVLFDNTGSGTVVQIVDSWQPQAQPGVMVAQN